MSNQILIFNTKNPSEAKYQFLIKEHEDVGTKHFNDFKAFIKYSNDMEDVYKKLNYTTQIKNVKY